MTGDKFITEAEVEKALDWLRDSAAEIGQAKARAVKAEHMLKHVEALMFKCSDEKSAEARKADARTTDEYVAALNEDAFAAGEMAKLYALREAASLKIEAWRTASSNLRSMKV
jgi:hypothetical protein